MWKRVLMSRTAHWIIGAPYEFSLTITPTATDVRNLLPYFLPPFFQRLTIQSEISKRGIWATDLPSTTLAIGLAALNLNLPLPMDDTQNMIGYVMAYLTSLPKPLLPPSEIPNLLEPTPAKLRSVIIAQPAPVRQLLRVLILHFNRVLEFRTQNKANDSVFKFIEPVIIRPEGGGACPAQEPVRRCLMANANDIFADIHGFEDARQQKVLFRAKMTVNQSEAGDDVLQAECGLIVNVIRQDELGWCTVFTSNGRTGLVHERLMKRLSPEEEREAASGPDISGKLDVIREKMPDLLIMLEAMKAEIALLQEALGG
jgi:hypothetical protein